MDDDHDLPLRIISNTISGSRLAITPVKHRSITPTASIQNNQRSNSVTKKLQAVQAAVEVQLPSLPQKYISRRKLRKWENANMVLLHQFLNKHSSNQARKYEATTEKVNVFRLANDSDREHFLTFIDPKRNTTSSSFAKNHINSSSADSIWICKVKKELRIVVIELFKKRENLLDYLTTLEECLLHFISTRTVLDDEFLSTSFLALFENDTNKVPIVMKVEEDCLFLPLKDLPLHRLITFAACQFYGLHSDTICTDGHRKEVKIWLPKNSSAVTSVDISFNHFIHDKLKLNVVHDN